MAVESIMGNLSTTGRLRANLAVGGGSEVTITPTYNSGTKIADYSIDGEEGEIYIPTYKFDLLSDTPTTTGEINLNNDINNYDLIIFIYGFTSGDKGRCSVSVPVDVLINDCPYVASPNNYNNGYILLVAYTGEYTRLLMGSGNNKVQLFDTHNAVVYKVYGIKY